jgi:hypothetical protein
VKQELLILLEYMSSSQVFLVFFLRGVWGLRVDQTFSFLSGVLFIIVCPFVDFFWSLYCLPFFELQLVIIPLVSPSLAQIIALLDNMIERSNKNRSMSKCKKRTIITLKDTSLQHINLYYYTIGDIGSRRACSGRIFDRWFHREIGREIHEQLLQPMAYDCLVFRSIFDIVFIFVIVLLLLFFPFILWSQNLFY